MRLSMTLKGVCVVAAVALATCTAGSASRFAPPAWLLQREKVTLAHDFGRATPIHVTYIPYPKKIAVVFEFKRPVVCGPCDPPPGRGALAARIIRVSFDRQTHDLAGASDGYAIQLCWVTGNRPSKSLCLHH